MEYGDFLQCVQERTKKYAGKGGIVSVNHVIKNNGCELDGLVIMEKGKNISPTIYLNGYFDEYQSGKDLDDIVTEIMQKYNENKDKLQIEADYFDDFNNIKACIVYKVINYSRNYRLLKNVPHKKILDLAVVYYCLLGQRDGENITALIHNSNMKKWNVTEQDLHYAAVENTPKLLESQIRPMSAIISDVLEDCELDSRTDEMYVLTNKSRLNGASCILYENVLRHFAEQIGRDLYILPSSVHEVILLPMYEDYDKRELECMVRDVNSDGVAKDEILSDRVYTYNRKDGMISL
ncbi:MAG: hypothetical protein J5981_00410 [Lachnospira sp.]|nr:hypothetical protein [Lachnospira sp.]